MIARSCYSSRFGVSVLRLHNVVRDYPGHRAVDGVSFEVPAGCFFSLLGPSGCGKTTTLRMVAGFEQPTSGDILLGGASVLHRKPYERNVSTVFQSYALFPHLTVRENVEFGLRRNGHKDAVRAAAEAIDLVQLSGKDARYPAQLSGGERQRVALARSLVLRPDVLLLDEPLAALDPQLRKQMRSELKRLQTATGIAFLFVTHDQEEALSLSDVIAVMNRGKIEQIGPPGDLYLRPATRFAASFLGTVNWIGGVGVRPEALRISPSAPGNSRSLAACVMRSVFLGNCRHVELRLATGEEAVSEVAHADRAFHPGDEVHVWWQASDEMAFPA